MKDNSYEAELDKTLLSINGATVDTGRPGYKTVHLSAVQAKQALLALITRVEIEAKIEVVELLRWRYKENNDQSVANTFLDAYNVIMDELKAELKALQTSKGEQE